MCDRTLEDLKIKIDVGQMFIEDLMSVNNLSFCFYVYCWVFQIE